MKKKPSDNQGGATGSEETIGDPLRVFDLPARKQPREEFERLGAQNVSDEVLLAILIRSGVRGSNVLDLADDLLAEYGSLSSLAQTSVADLMRIKGVGKVKAQVLKASLEVARRMSREKIDARPCMSNPESVANLLREDARTRDQEVFWVLLLNTKNHLIRQPLQVSKGILNSSLVHPREVFKEAVRSSCAAIIVVHNHPSGDITPSREDLKVTRELISAGKVMRIKLLDHIILGRSGVNGDADFLSLRESGLVDFQKG